MPAVTLEHRATLRVGGSEAVDFLQRIVTGDLDALDDGVAKPCALLSPQGKVLHEFLIARDDGGVLIDVSRAFLPDLARRLMMYRLHADVTFEPRPSAVVRAVWDAAAPLRDARFGDAVGRAHEASEDDGTLAEWTRLRIAAGVAELGTDFAPDTYFPHDLGMPAMGAVSVRKGCFVGQEVVSRMHHRNTGRRGVARVRGRSALPAPGTDIVANDRPIGALGSVLDRDGLAIVRTDRLEDAVAGGHDVLADGVALTLEPIARAAPA